MSTTLQIIERVQARIGSVVNATVSPKYPLKKGDTKIIVDRVDTSAQQHFAGQQLAIHDNEEMECHTVKCLKRVDGAFTDYEIHLCQPITQKWGNPETLITKLHHNRMVDDIVLGNPDHLDGYPSITIEPLAVEREPFTLSDWLETTPIDVGIWTDATNYVEAYKLMMHLAGLVKDALASSRFADSLFDQRAEIKSYDGAVDRDHLLKSCTVGFTIKRLVGRRRNDIENEHFDWWMHHQENDPALHAYWETLLSSA